MANLLEILIGAEKLMLVDEERYTHNNGRQWLSNYLERTGILKNPDLYKELNHDDRTMALIIKGHDPSSNYIEGEFQLGHKKTREEIPTVMPGFFMPKNPKDFTPEKEIERVINYIDQRIIPQLTSKQKQIPVFVEDILIDHYRISRVEEIQKTQDADKQEAHKFRADVYAVLKREEGSATYGSVVGYWDLEAKRMLTSPNNSRAQKNQIIFNCVYNLLNTAMKVEGETKQLEKWMHTLRNLSRTLVNSQSDYYNHNTQPEPRAWKQLDWPYQTRYTEADTLSDKEKINMALQPDLNIATANDVRVKGIDQALFLDPQVLSELKKHLNENLFNHELEVKLYDLDVELRKK